MGSIVAEVFTWRSGGAGWGMGLRVVGMEVWVGGRGSKWWCSSIELVKHLHVGSYHWAIKKDITEGIGQVSDDVLGGARRRNISVWKSERGSATVLVQPEIYPLTNVTSHEVPTVLGLEMGKWV